MGTHNIIPKIEKNSPFTPGVPAPPEMFTGRFKELESVSQGLHQSLNGKPTYTLVKGDRGVGKSSFVHIIKEHASNHLGFLSTYVNVGSAQTLNEAILLIIETLGTETLNKNKLKDKISSLFGENTFKVGAFGFNVSLNKKEANKIHNKENFLGFLKNFVSEILKKDFNGLLLIIDDINGIAKKPEFAGFIKSLVDTIAINIGEFNFSLIISATPSKWSQVTSNHPSISRIFVPIELKTMEGQEVKEFYNKAFHKVNIELEKGSLSKMTAFSQGYPQLVQELGDAIFWTDKDFFISNDDVIKGLEQAVTIVGQKYIDDQVIKAIKSKRYNLILNFMSKIPIKSIFTKSELRKNFPSSIKDAVLNNFLKKMRDLNILKRGDMRGEYEFTNFFYYVYMIYFNSYD